MKLSDVGERFLVELARRVCRKGPKIRVGIGDDAAAIDVDDQCLIATTDMLVASTHFPPRTTPEQMGLKSVVVNLSDLAAMGARPIGLLFSVGLPRELEVGFVERLVRAMDKTAVDYGAHVIGGDLDESEEIVIAGTALGLVSKREILKRSGARPNNIILTTGKLGAASAGLKILLEGLSPRGFEELIEAQLEPIARVKEGMALARSGVVNSAIDITDSLASNLWQISRESGVKLVIDRTKVPEHPLVRKFAGRYGFNVDDFVLFGGEDFELLFTIRPEGLERVRRALKSTGTSATVIGRVTEGEGVFIRAGGKTQPLPDRGYEHFKGHPDSATE